MILPLASTPYLTPSYYISKHRIGLNILNDNKNHEYQKLDQVDFFTGRLNVYVFSGDEKHFFFFKPWTGMSEYQGAKLRSIWNSEQRNSYPYDSLKCLSFPVTDGHLVGPLGVQGRGDSGPGPVLLLSQLRLLLILLVHIL